MSDSAHLATAPATGFGRALDRVEFVSDRLAALAMFLTMAVVASDVVARYGFHHPLAWVQDALVLYLIPAMFFLGLPGSYARNAHISVDFVILKIPPRWVAVAMLVGRVASIAFFLCVLYVGADHALEAFRSDETVSGVVVFPVWPSYALVPVGSALVLLRMFSQLAGDVSSVLRGGAAFPSNSEHAEVKEPAK